MEKHSMGKVSMPKCHIPSQPAFAAPVDNDGSKAMKRL